MHSPTVPTRDLFAQVHEALDALAGEVLGAEVSDVDLSWAVDELQRIENRVAAEKLRRLGEFDNRQAYIAFGARSGADWAARNLNLTPGQAKGLADTADRLQDLPETSKKFADGDLGPDQAAAAARAAQDVAEQDLAEFDQLAAQQGCDRDKHALRKELDAFAAAKNKDHLAEKERFQHSTRRLRRWTDDDGMRRYDIRVPAVAGAHIDAAIDALSRKTNRDTRSIEQRRADAITTVCEQALNTGDLPDVAAQRPHIIMITHDDDRPATLDGYGPVSAATEALIACDSHTTEIVVDDLGAPLVVKPTKKDPTRKQRLAVIARDQHCIGCGAAASQCQVHHIRWRRNGGLTTVDNLVLVCANCHFHIHHLGWQVTRTTDGGYQAAPPAEPLRHTA